jgi:hypothetical protein
MIVSSLEGLWRELVTAALLGTDRREPPDPPTGLIGDLVDDTVRTDSASRMLATVGAVTAARRAAFVPLPAADPCQPPQADARLICPPHAAATWRTVVADWPVLEDEWVLSVIEHGFRLAPDVLVELLLRHRSDAVRRARVALAGGPLTAWLVGQLPGLEAIGSRAVDAALVTSLPALAIPPELASLVEADAHTFAKRIMSGFRAGEFGPAHRAVLVNLFARCRPAVLLDVADELTRFGYGQALACADLARLRHRMLAELGAKV